MTTCLPVVQVYDEATKYSINLLRDTRTDKMRYVFDCVLDGKIDVNRYAAAFKYPFPRTTTEPPQRQCEELLRDYVAGIFQPYTQVGGTHYNKYKDFQPWDAWRLWNLNAFQGAILKYVVRYRDKNGIEDLKKARHYLDKLIECEEEKSK